MEQFKSPYEWYELIPKVRHSYYLKNETVCIEDKLYLPVIWADANLNYGEPYGLLYFPKIYGGPYNHTKYKGAKWFGVRVFSPDDWDCDFDIDLNDGMSVGQANIPYNELIKIVKEIVSTGPVNPKELFSTIHESFVKAFPDMKIHVGY